MKMNMSNSLICRYPVILPDSYTRSSIRFVNRKGDLPDTDHQCGSFPVINV